MNRDPRLRRTLNRISSTIETANLNTQASLWNISQTYITPCLSSVSQCLESACYPCVGRPRERARARQRRSLAATRGRPEFVFDFYNDSWDSESGEDERTGLLGGMSWGADELDRLLAGTSGEQPKRKPGMNYGTAFGQQRRRRRSTGAAAKTEDPTLLPGSSMFGFLERLPWKIGGRGVRYKPSAADLQENPGGIKHKGEEAGGGEASALLDDSNDDSGLEDYELGYQEVEGPSGKQRRHQGQNLKHKRNRSGTTTSRNSQETQTSLSSRGDLFPSEDEAADAIPLDDEFAITLGRRSNDNDDAQEGLADAESGKSGRTKSSRSMSKSTQRSKKPRPERRKSGIGTTTPQSKRSRLSRTSSDSNQARTQNQPDTPTSLDERRMPLHETSVLEDEDAEELASPTTVDATSHIELPSIDDLRREEEDARQRDDAEVRRKRAAARQLARERGLVVSPEPDEAEAEQAIEKATLSFRSATGPADDSPQTQDLGSTATSNNDSRQSQEDKP